MILIVGGTGMLGSALAARLVDANHDVEVMTRHPHKHAAGLPNSIRLIEGDLTDHQSIQRAVAGKTCVIAAAHSILGRGRSASKYVDEIGTKNLIDECIAAGVDHFIYVSAWFDPEQKRSAFFATKERVESYLRSTALAHTILRPTAFIDMHAEQLIGQRIREGKPVIVFGSGTITRNFVAADDVAAIIVENIENHASESQTIAVGGPENFSTMDIVKTYEDFLKVAAKTSHLPLGLVAALRWILKPFHSGVSQVLEMSLQTERYGDGFVIDDHPGCARNSSLSSWLRDQ